MWLDILTGTLLIIALLQGYKNGFIRAVISTFSLFLGLILAFQFAGWVAIWLKQQTKITTNFLPLITKDGIKSRVDFVCLYRSPFLNGITTRVLRPPSKSV